MLSARATRARIRHLVSRLGNVVEYKAVEPFAREGVVLILNELLQAEQLGRSRCECAWGGRECARGWFLPSEARYCDSCARKHLVRVRVDLGRARRWKMALSALKGEDGHVVDFWLGLWGPQEQVVATPTWLANPEEGELAMHFGIKWRKSN